MYITKEHINTTVLLQKSTFNCSTTKKLIGKKAKIIAYSREQYIDIELFDNNNIITVHHSELIPVINTPIKK